MLPASARMPSVTPGIWTHLGQRARVWPGRNWPLGATWSPESTNFAVYAPNATACWVCLFDDDGVETRHQLTEHSLGIWHGALPGRRAGHALRLPGRRPVGARPRGCGSTRTSCCSTPTPWPPPARCAPEPAIFGYQMGDPTQRRRAGLRAVHRAQRRRRPVLRLGGRRRRCGAGGATPSIYELHVKGFTKLHDRVPEELRGTYAGLGSPAVVEYLARPRRHRRRAAAGAPVLLRAGAARARADELLGLQHDQLLRPRRRRTPRRATAASRSPSSSRW